MPKISTPTKSFIVLLCLVIFGMCLTLVLWSDLSPAPYYYSPEQSSYQQTIPTAAKPAQNAPPPVDTSSWQVYSNKQYNFSFKYKPGWKVLAAKTDGEFTVLQVDPGAKYYNIKIYISNKGYYALGGLPLEQTTVGGQPATEVNHMLYGVMDGNYYYTFDVGLSVSLTPNFDGLVNSVTFGS